MRTLSCKKSELGDSSKKGIQKKKYSKNSPQKYRKQRRQNQSACSPIRPKLPVLPRPTPHTNTMPPKKVHKKCNVCQKQHCTARLHSSTVSTRRRCRRTCHLSVSKKCANSWHSTSRGREEKGLRVEQDFMSYAVRDLPEICDVDPAEVRRVATWLLAPAYGLCYTLVHVKL